MAMKELTRNDITGWIRACHNLNERINVSFYSEQKHLYPSFLHAESSSIFLFSSRPLANGSW